MDKIEVGADGGVALIGYNAVMIMHAATIARGLEMHIRTKGGMRLTRMATPKHLMQMASELTGTKFKAREYAKAAAACRDWATNMAALIQAKEPAVKN